MFYGQPNQMPVRPGFDYPQQMMPHGAPRGPMPPRGPGGVPGYQMPAYPMPMQPGRQQGPGRQRRGPNQRGGMPQRNMSPQNRNSHFRYTSNARNQPPQVMDMSSKGHHLSSRCPQRLL